jgi:hypothetical protein
MFSRQEKRLGDLAAGTIVIQVEAPQAAATFPISEQAKHLIQELLEIEADFSQLLPDDFAVIREYLQRRKAMASKARAQLSLQLAQQAKSIVALEKLPQAATSDVFLEAVYLAYQQERDNSTRRQGESLLIFSLSPCTPALLPLSSHPFQGLSHH